MHVHIQGDDQALARLGTTPAAVFDVVERVVGGSGASLMLLIYLVPGPGWDAVCHHRWFRPEDLHNGTVPALPDRFRVIRVAMGQNTYPHESIDAYGWQWYFGTFLDHLAAVVAHEMYHSTQPHFARYRCNDEWDANASALRHVTDLGFQVAARAPRRGVRAHG